MRHFIFSVLLAITISILPAATYAIDADLTPAQYKTAKKMSSAFCEAKNDGLSFESAFEASKVGLWKNIYFGGIMLDQVKNGWAIGKTEGMTDDEMNLTINKDTDKYFSDLAAFIENKIQKDCPLNKQESVLLKAELDTIINGEEEEA